MFKAMQVENQGRINCLWLICAADVLPVFAPVTEQLCNQPQTTRHHISTQTKEWVHELHVLNLQEDTNY